MMAEVQRGEETIELGGDDVEDGYHSVSNDWSFFFLQDDFVEKVKKMGLGGELRGCCFRSVCWKLYLGILPENYSQWVPELQRKRAAYLDVKKQYLSDPRNRAGEVDTAINNPLSLDSESPWNRYFQDEELRRAIVQDVERTNPEMEFFQDERVKEMMTNILFCYSRVHDQLGYRQGFHELLAPILFVLDSDKRDRATVSSSDSCAQDMLVVLDPEAVEADAYVMLSAVMETCSSWYEHGPATPKKTAAYDDAKPFVSDDDALPSSEVVSTLDRIQNRLLKKEDLQLHFHLTKLGILPQLYGIRWVRLLFAREYDLLDILVLWDALFAYSAKMDLVENIALAMLLYIRDALLSGSYAEVMQLLFNYPPVVDVHYMVRRALFLSSPEIYPRPPNWQLNIHDPAGTSHAVETSPSRVVGSTARAIPSAMKSVITKGARNVAGKAVSSVAWYRSKPKKAPASQSPRSTFFVPGTASASSSPSPPPVATGLERQTPSTTSVGKNQTVTTFSSVESAEDQLDKLKTMCQFCSDRMDSCLGVFEQVAVQATPSEGGQEQLYLAVAALKQVRDLLRGTLGFNLTPQELKQLLFSEEEHIIINGSSSAEPSTSKDSGNNSTATQGTSTVSNPLTDATSTD